MFRRHYAHKYGSLLLLLLLTGDPSNGLAFAERGAWLSFSTSPMTHRHFFGVGGTEEEEAEEECLSVHIPDKVTLTLVPYSVKTFQSPFRWICVDLKWRSIVCRSVCDRMKSNAV